MQRSLSDWLAWQETLNPSEIELGLERVRQVADRLSLNRPATGVVTVGGTNGKGSTVSFIENVCAENGLRTAAYTSPHLIRYNERMRVDRQDVDDKWLIEQFAAIDEIRGEIPLTYFEFGTLAALRGFSGAQVDVWILEVGLGGRLDAVNVIDPDVSVVTTIGLDHQEWLGDTIDEIAVEKAGILRCDRPAFYGDEPVPDGFRRTADDIGANLSCFGSDFGYVEEHPDSWSWQGRTTTLEGLSRPSLVDAAQLRNMSLALVAVEACDPRLVKRAPVEQALEASRPPGRFQVIHRDRQWVVDVAHNPQAVGVLRQRLLALEGRSSMTVVIGLLADKPVEAFVAPLADLADRWIVCAIDSSRGRDASELAAVISQVVGGNVMTAETPELALDWAVAASEPGERILVTGSFHIAGPALSWLGLY